MSNLDKMMIRRYTRELWRALDTREKKNNVSKIVAIANDLRVFCTDEDVIEAARKLS